MKTIFLVDDSDVIRNIIKQTLSLHGYEDIQTAEDGVKALEKIRQFKGTIGLFVFDVNMPNMNGIELVKQVRALDASTPILMLTTETDKSKMMSAREFGATGWIVKPFQGDQFIKVVEMYLK